MTSSPVGFHKFLKDSILTFSQQFLSLVLGFAVSIILARSLGKSGVGVFTLVLLFSTLTTTFVSFGTPAATTYLLGSKKYTLSETLSNTISISLFQGFLGILVAGSIIFFFKDYFWEGVDIYYLYWTLLIIPFNLANMNLRAIFHALESFKYFNVIALSQLFWTTILLIALLLLQSMSVLNAIFVNITAALLTFALTIHLLRRHTPLQLGIHSAYLRDNLHYGVKVYISSIFTFFNYKQDRFLLNNFLSPSSVGVYNIGASFGEKLWLASQSVSTVLFPKIASLKGDEDQRRRMTPFITRHIFTGTTVGAAILYWISPFLIQLFYGSEFVGAADVLRIILPGVVSLTIARIVANDIAGRGRPGINTSIAGFSLSVNLVANILLIPKLGIRGAAWASTISYTSSAILQTGIYSRIAKVSWFSLFIIRLSDLLIWSRLIRGWRQRR